MTNASGESAAQAAARLRFVCDQAFTLHPAVGVRAVLHVLACLVDRSMPVQSADALLQRLAFAWRTVSAAEAQRLADRGVVVVAGATGAGGGHVVVVYPGGMRIAGGYSYRDARGRRRTAAFTQTLSPRCLSTGLAGRPGTRSRGERTVRDVWGARAVRRVRYFTPVSE